MSCLAAVLGWIGLELQLKWKCQILRIIAARLQQSRELIYLSWGVMIDSCENLKINHTEQTKQIHSFFIAEHKPQETPR